MEAVRIEHPLEPIYAVDSRVLVLGTMPSPKSREIGFYYGHPQNRFWKVMGALFGAPQLPGLAHTGLPSTSPANARMRLDDLVKAYLPIRETLVRRDGGGR